MKNFLTLLFIFLLSGIAILKGTILLAPSPAAMVPGVPSSSGTAPGVPYIGRIEVLNGCGAGGSAHLVAEYLRKNNFDVKTIGNADNWNYPETMIIARTPDTMIAVQVAGVLRTGNMVMIRTRENQYDVTVIVGPDFRERVR